MTRTKPRVFLSLFLVLMLVVAALPTAAFAADVEDTHTHEETAVVTTEPTEPAAEETTAPTEEVTTPEEETTPAEPESGAPEEEPVPAATSGYIGESAVYWEFDASTGFLKISGSGGCETFTSAEDQPWKHLREQIKEVWFWTIDGNYQNSEYGNYQVHAVQVNGTLNLGEQDSTSEFPKIMYFNTVISSGSAGSSDYGPIEINGGTFNLYSGTISHNKSARGGGVTVLSNGTANLIGGTISNNTSNTGGGVAMRYGGTINLSGTTIKANSAVTGGGIHIWGENSKPTGTLNITGGEVISNTTTGNDSGSVHVTGDTTSFKISGKPVINNNTGNDSSIKNVYLESNRYITLAGALQPGAAIGVNCNNASSNTEIAQGTETYTVTDADAAHFFFDGGTMGIKKGENENKLILANWDDVVSGITLTTDKDTYAPGEEITVTVKYTGQPIYGYAYTLSYDSSAVTLKATEPAQVLSVNEHINDAAGATTVTKTYTFTANTPSNGSTTAEFSLSKAEVTPASGSGLGDSTAVTVTPKTVTILGSLTVTEPTGLSAEYTGAALTIPTITTVPDGATVSYKVDNGAATTNPTATNVGTYTVAYTVSMNGYQAVTGGYEFTVTSHALTEADFTIDTAAKTYTGEDIKPSVAVANGKSLQSGDYKVTYSANKDAGTATITIEAQGSNCTGTVTKTFTINKAPLTVKVNDAKVTLGDPLDAAVTYTITGWVNGEGTSLEATLKSGLTYDMTGSGNAVNDTRTVTPKLADNATAPANYDITFTPGTLTIVDLADGEYVVEIIRASESAGTSDYISGYALVLVYTNKDVTLKYDGALMVDTNKQATYKYNGETAYDHVYAAVVKLTDELTDDTIKGKIATNASITDTTGLVKLSTTANDVNQTGKVDNADLVCVSGALNSDMYGYYTSASHVLIAADVDGDKHVTADDAAAVKDAGMPQ